MEFLTGQLRPIYPFLGELYGAAWTTLTLSAQAIVAALILGTIVALGRVSTNRLIRIAAGCYVELLRNIPLLVLLYFIYFLMPALGLRFSPLTSALVGMALHESAYMTEILRAGLIAVPIGQYEAAQSQGMTRWQVQRHIVLPQVFRTIYAPLGTQFTMVIIASSLASAISVDEVTGWMQTVGADTVRFFDVFFIAAIVYIVLCQFVYVLHAVVGRVLFGGLSRG